MSEDPKTPVFTLGFILFSIIVIIIATFTLGMLGLPFWIEMMIGGYLGWNIRQFYFGPWQVIQTAALISLNNWLKRK